MVAGLFVDMEVVLDRDESDLGLFGVPCFEVLIFPMQEYFPFSMIYM